MSEDFDRFLKSAADVVREKDRAAQRLKDEADAAAKAKASERQRLQNRWDAVKSSLFGVIAQSNSALSPVEIELKVEEEVDVGGAIARLNIMTYRFGSPIGSSIKLNVTGIGKQQIIWYRGEQNYDPKLPHIDECSAKDYADLLTTFVDDAISSL